MNHFGIQEWYCAKHTVILRKRNSCPGLAGSDEHEGDELKAKACEHDTEVKLKHRRGNSITRLQLLQANAGTKNLPGEKSDIQNDTGDQAGREVQEGDGKKNKEHVKEDNEDMVVREIL